MNYYLVYWVKSCNFVASNYSKKILNDYVTQSSYI
jgi:hypothetical protein